MLAGAWMTRRRSIDKHALREQLIAKLTAALDTARAAHASAVEGAFHPEAKAENDKDTRGLEQSYLARGQAQRVAELEAAVVETSALELRSFGPSDRIAISALVTVEEDDEEARFFLAPHGGGTVLADLVQVVTPSSPLGQSLLGKQVDDEVELAVAGKVRELVIVEVA
jgi:transcription elongation GreA/GreB family factor